LINPSDPFELFEADLVRLVSTGEVAVVVVEDEDDKMAMGVDSSNVLFKTETTAKLLMR
jgi:hypothetical protein